LIVKSYKNVRKLKEIVKDYVMTRKNCRFLSILGEIASFN